MNNTFDQTAKADAGKPRLTLVPRRIILAIAQIREYRNAKYHDPDLTQAGLNIIRLRKKARDKRRS